MSTPPRVVRGHRRSRRLVRGRRDARARRRDLDDFELERTPQTPRGRARAARHVRGAVRRRGTPEPTPTTGAGCSPPSLEALALARSRRASSLLFVVVRAGLSTPSRPASTSAAAPAAAARPATSAAPPTGSAPLPAARRERRLRAARGGRRASSSAPRGRALARPDGPRAHARRRRDERGGRRDAAPPPRVPRAGPALPREAAPRRTVADPAGFAGLRPFRGRDRLDRRGGGRLAVPRGRAALRRGLPRARPPRGRIPRRARTRDSRVLVAAPVPPADAELRAARRRLPLRRPAARGSSTAAQKQFLRLGPRNVARSRRKLREVQADARRRPSAPASNSRAADPRTAARRPRQPATAAYSRLAHGPDASSSSTTRSRTTRGARARRSPRCSAGRHPPRSPRPSCGSAPTRRPRRAIVEPGGLGTLDRADRPRPAGRPGPRRLPRVSATSCRSSSRSSPLPSRCRSRRTRTASRPGAAGHGRTPRACRSTRRGATTATRTTSRSSSARSLRSSPSRASARPTRSRDDSSRSWLRSCSTELGRAARERGPLALRALFARLLTLDARGARARAAPCRRARPHVAATSCAWQLGRAPAREATRDDVGALAPLYLHLLLLAPGEALFLPAGELHAYLEGTALELMANSDNVLRGGLTPKHVDVAELLATLVFEPRPPEILRAPPIAVRASDATARRRGSSSWGCSTSRRPALPATGRPAGSRSCWG